MVETATSTLATPGQELLGHPRGVDVRVRDPAVVDRHHLVRAVPAQTGAAVVVHRPLHAGPPAEPVVVAGHRLDLDARRSSPASRASCSRTTAALSAAAPAGWRAAGRSRRSGPARPRGRRDDAVGRRLQHLDRVGAPERRAVVAVGDDGADPLPRQRVPDEHHPALVPGHAVPAVGDRADGQLDLVPEGGHRRLGGTQDSPPPRRPD